MLTALTQLANKPLKLKFGLGTNSKSIPVVFQSPNKLSSHIGNNSVSFEILCAVTSRILGELESVLDVTTQLYCHSKLMFPPGSNPRYIGRLREKPSQTWFLNVIIFGTEDLEDTVGEHLSRYGLYLQDPLGCERHVPYRNPHIIPLESDEIIMADSFGSDSGNLEIERLEAGPDLLAELMKDEIPLPETEAPAIVKTALFPYVSPSPYSFLFCFRIRLTVSIGIKSRH
jgi:SWI/SNF-related matrix-associated actin-dependent regulator of chromatin subfamily A3